MKTKGKPSELLLKQWHEDPKNWKLGVFYYNKDDKRLFPPRRFIIFKWDRWTINYANAYSILAVVALIAILLIVGVMIS
jgi:uncharacterized membrane protein